MTTPDVPRPQPVENTRVTAVGRRLKDLAGKYTQAKREQKRTERLATRFQEAGSEPYKVFDSLGLSVAGIPAVFSCETETELKSRLAGALFGEVGYNKLRVEEAAKNNAVIKKNETLKLWQELYPEAEVVPHPFGQNSLQGISMPDGLVVNQSGKIVGIIQYELSLKHDTIQHKFRAFEAFTKAFPMLVTPDVQFVIVRPGIQNNQIPEGYREGQNPKIQHRSLGFKTHQFRQFCDTWYQSYRPEIAEEEPSMDPEDKFGPSLSDLWKEKMFQQERSGHLRRGREEN